MRERKSSWTNVNFVLSNKRIGRRKCKWTDVRAPNGTRNILTFLLLHFSCVCTRSELAFRITVISLILAMATPTHCSPSRSSLSCCQFDHSSQDMRDPTIIANNYFLQQEKHSFPKRPEIDLSFRDIRYHVKEWSIRNFSIGKCVNKQENKSINNNKRI